MENSKVELIEKLFSWHKETPILDAKGVEIGKVYQRLCGDADIQKSRVTALRYSREMRIKLKDINSDEYLAYVDAYDDLSKEDLINLILFDELIEIRNKVEKDFYFPDPQEPKDDDTEEWENYQVLVDSWEDRRTEKLNSLVTEAIEDRKFELNNKSLEEIQKQVRLSKINNLCENELRIRFMEMVTYLGTYKDKKFKKRLFNSFQEFLDSPDILKNQLINGYNSLELSSVNLKGLQEIKHLGEK